MKALVLCMFITGCSAVQWIPSSACEQVKYERVNSHVTIAAECNI